jgi:murein L,D-transpeptidase YafK
LSLLGRCLKYSAALAGIIGLSGSVAAMSFLPGCTSMQAVEPSASSRASALFADRIIVKKSQRRLYLMRDGKPIRTYRISLGIEPVGHKERQGDNRTPEGGYYINWRNPNSQFYKALSISYPNQQDRLRAARYGWDPGGDIMIHGEPRRGGDGPLRDLVRAEDWTQGCIAVSNLAIDEIWRYTVDGTPIEILP